MILICHLIGYQDSCTWQTFPPHGLHRVSNLIHVTKCVASHRLISSWIINEFENFEVRPIHWYLFYVARGKLSCHNKILDINYLSYGQYTDRNSPLNLWFSVARMIHHLNENVQTRHHDFLSAIGTATFLWFDFACSLLGYS